MLQNRFFIFSIFSVLSLTLFITGLTYYFYKPGPLEQNKTLVIPSGMTEKEIVVLLSDNNILRLPKVFLLSNLLLKPSSFKAGEYNFSKGISPLQLLNTLEKGHIIQHRITIPEGLSSYQISQLIENNPLLSGSMPEIKEGLLLPDTYFFIRNESRKNLLARMEKKQQEFLDKFWDKRQKVPWVSSREEALVLASIIEKEAVLDSERKKIASVFINRLKKGMRLQADPTTLYAVTNGTMILDRDLTHEDLKKHSPYNTYVIRGLPPHPICHPGKASIMAALYPDELKNYYFVADGKGRHLFAKTLAEHNKNVVKYRGL